MNDPWGDMTHVNPGYGKARFSKAEIRDITIAVLVLSVAFSIMLYVDDLFFYDRTLNMLAVFGLSLLLVICSFMLHELAHKFVAQKYGAMAEFKVFMPGLLMALVFSFFGFLFAAPGAVYIYGRIDQKTNGKISASGPIVNLAIGAVALAAWLMTTGMFSDILFLFAWLNVFLALFNILPIPPFDGSKIYKWNPFVYVIMIVAAIAMFATMLFY